jgi:hypothetical protein
MEQRPCNKKLSLLQFQKKFGSEKACQKHLLRLRWPEEFRCPRCQHGEAYFHRTRHLYHCKACGYQASLTAGTIFHKTRPPIKKWFWMIWLMGRQKSGICMQSLPRMPDIPSYRTVRGMGHKIRKALDDRDAYYKLAGLLEMDDTYSGASQPDKRGVAPLARPMWWCAPTAGRVTTSWLVRPAAMSGWFPVRVPRR